MNKNVKPKTEIEDHAESSPESLLNQLENQDIPVINIVLDPGQVPSNTNSLNVQIPLFIKKIWKMINDPSTDDIISWTEDGQGFVIHDQLKFISETLPKYFKHNQMSSFVRQLNLYDFHKVQNVEDECHFTQPFFQKDLPELLPLIKRKTQPSRPKASTSRLSNNQQQQNQHQTDVQKLQTTLKEIKTKSDTISNEMTKLRQENAALWREMNSLRLKYSKQTKIINKLIHFLIAYVQKHHNARSSRGGRTVSTSNSNKYLKTGPKILELDYRYRNNPHEFWSEFDEHHDKNGVENVAYTVVEPGENVSDNENPQTRQSPLPNMQVSTALEDILPSASQNLTNQNPQNLPQFDYSTSIPSTSKTPSNGALQRARGQESLGYRIDNSRVERNQIKELLMNLTPEDMTNFYKLVNDNYKLQEDDLMHDAEQDLEVVKEPTDSQPQGAQVDLDSVMDKNDNFDNGQLSEAVWNDIIQVQSEQPDVVTYPNNLNEPNVDPSTSIGLGTDELLNTDDLLTNVSVDQYFSID
ncbi:heat shock factor protein-like [Anthonomus grandis grandis]|uniref:heat shock factor protein-like n=1 Tax=Anthonomus grandis grandis TaxID=2921223 RepID=UPI0021651816|nr:heat shock factor protein-like [Anthonomus grandis grandis]